MATRKVATAKVVKRVGPKASNGDSRNGADHHDGAPSAGPSRLQKDVSGRIVEFFSEKDICPVCKSDRYLNPDLRLLVSRCYHKMCESCIDRIFTLGPEPCPICGQILRKTNFSPQTFEDLGVEKEVVIRKRIAKCFNKREQDFATLRDFNNYLEEVEDITFNLINGVDVADTEAKIKRFQAENQELIAQNAVSEAYEAQVSKRAEEAEKKNREDRKAKLLLLEQEAAKEERKLKDATIKSLETSDVSGSKLVAKQKALALKKSSARALAMETDFMSPAMGPSFAGLIDPNAPVAAPVDVLADLADYDHYDHFFNIPPSYPFDSAEVEMEDLSFIGGFNWETVWEKEVRSAVMGLFTPALEGVGNEILRDVEMALT